MATTRKIIHIDMDCFYAAIEMRDFPHLASKPIAVGGEPSRRGVISTCNYAARKFGVHSAMPSRQRGGQFVTVIGGVVTQRGPHMKGGGSASKPWIRVQRERR